MIDTFLFLKKIVYFRKKKYYRGKVENLNELFHKKLIKLK